ncbi:hypothetical protein OUZ56_028119 [Daphnia magna]|uniref:Uncharacterized protein n=1 Tax=Daphnia magna TaxID=35525 RepID=A0ABR0B2W9_9CRUS|nr:hypothetical protein OUZ56_028119 [Daphnia magna]
MLTNDVSQSSDTDSSEEFELIYRCFSTISKGNRIHTKRCIGEQLARIKFNLEEKREICQFGNSDDFRNQLETAYCSSASSSYVLVSSFS